VFSCDVQVLQLLGALNGLTVEQAAEYKSWGDALRSRMDVNGWRVEVPAT
jgi:hypothetical protein